MGKVFAVILLCFLFYTPYFKVGSIGVFTGYFLFFLPWLFLLKKGKLTLGFHEKNIIVLILLSFTVICLMYFLNLLKLPWGMVDPRAIKLYVSILFIYLSSYAIYTLFLRKFTVADLLKVIYFAGLINCLVVLMLYSSEAFASLFYDVILVNPRTFTYAILRYPGFSYDGASYLSVFYAFIFMIGIIVYFNKHESKKMSTLILVCQGVIVICMIFTGRTGFILLGIGGLLYILYVFYLKKVLKRSFLKRFLIIILACLISIPIIINLIDYLGLGWMTDWALGFIGKILTGNITHSDSSVKGLIENHYFLPYNFLDLLIGTSDFGTTDALFHSDVGYVKFIFGAGLIGLSSWFLVIFYFMFIAVKYFLVNSRLSFMILFICVSLLIVNMKDFYFWYPYGHYILLFILTFSLLDRAKKVKEIRSWEINHEG